METNNGSPWFNDQTYVDTLSPEAISSFIKTTHEVYKDKIGDKFGKSVPCIFTDEPQFATKTQLSNPLAENDVFLPWTADLPVSFKKAYDEDIVANLCGGHRLAHLRRGMRHGVAAEIDYSHASSS